MKLILGSAFIALSALAVSVSVASGQAKGNTGPSDRSHSDASSSSSGLGRRAKDHHPVTSWISMHDCVALGAKVTPHSGCSSGYKCVNGEHTVCIKDD